MNCSLPGPSVQGILQARILECKAMPFSGEGENSNPFNNKGHSRYLCPTFSAWNVGDLGSIPGLGRSTGEGIGYPLLYSWASLVSQLVKNLSNNVRPGFDPWVRKIPWKGERLPTPAFWPGDFHGLYSPWGRKESDMTEQLSLSLSPCNPDSTVGLLFSSQLFTTFCNTIHFIYMLFF